MWSIVKRPVVWGAAGILIVSLLVAFFPGRAPEGSRNASPSSPYLPTHRPPRPEAATLSPVREFTVDASSPDRWVFFSFDQGTVIPTSFGSAEWDLAFQRHKVFTNGGATNPKGRGGAVEIVGVTLEEVGEVPDRELVADLPTRDHRGTENPLLARWYRYNWMNHTVSPKQSVFVVRTADGRYAKLQFMSYYCRGGRAGCVTFRYRYQGNGTRVLR